MITFHWSLELSDLDIEFDYVPGKKNALADALSRMVEEGVAKTLEPEREGYEFGKYVLPQTPEEAEKRHKEDVQLRKEALVKRKEKAVRKEAKRISPSPPKQTKWTATQRRGHEIAHPYVEPEC